MTLEAFWESGLVLGRGAYQQLVWNIMDDEQWVLLESSPTLLHFHNFLALLSYPSCLCPEQDHRAHHRVHPFLWELVCLKPRAWQCQEPGSPEEVTRTLAQWAWLARHSSLVFSPENKWGDLLSHLFSLPPTLCCLVKWTRYRSRVVRCVFSEGNNLDWNKTLVLLSLEVSTQI